MTEVEIMKDLSVPDLPFHEKKIPAAIAVEIVDPLERGGAARALPGTDEDPPFRKRRGSGPGFYEWISASGSTEILASSISQQQTPIPYAMAKSQNAVVYPAISPAFLADSLIASTATFCAAA